VRIHTYILDFEEQGLVTRTFRRLDPERQQAILGAIVEEAVQKGPTEVNIKQVAVRAGVSVGALYTYFPDRNAMLDFAVQVCARIVTESFDEFRPYLAALPLREALAMHLAGGIEWSRTYNDLVRLFARAAYHGDPDLGEQLVRPVADKMREMVHDILSRAAERGEIRADVDLEAATRIVHTLMIAVGDSQLLPYLNTYFQVTDEDMPPERAMESLVTLVMNGLGQRDQSGGAGK
jgi:AcrR family transcriptional regulator